MEEITTFQPNLSLTGEGESMKCEGPSSRTLYLVKMFSSTNLNRLIEISNVPHSSTKSKNWSKSQEEAEKRRCVINNFIAVCFFFFVIE